MAGAPKGLQNGQGGVVDRLREDMPCPDQPILQAGVTMAGKTVTFRGHFRSGADTEGTDPDRFGHFRTYPDNFGQVTHRLARRADQLPAVKAIEMGLAS